MSMQTTSTSNATTARNFEFLSVPASTAINGRGLSRRRSETESGAEITDKQSVNTSQRPTTEKTRQKNLREQLHLSIANLKILTSHFAMYIPTEWREKLFSQIENLLDEDEWYDGDLPIQMPSFRSFLRAVIYLNAARRPGLGVSDVGNVIASWTREKDVLMFEFFPDDMVRWFVSYKNKGKSKTASGETSVSLLPRVLASYKIEYWSFYDSD